MTQEIEFDAGKHMDRAYFGTVGHFFAQASIHYENKDDRALYDTLHNLYGMIPPRATKKYEEELELLFKGVKERTTKSALYDLWKIRRLLTAAMDDASMLFNRWARKEKKNIIV